ncbi:lysophospholipid acyltransferase family protein [Paraburkholderia sp. 22099]|jgi:1-acyl-sn-glycerol-3-phosphate acyltransferase|uniref:1-acyl-sn-glycerol-3-phosphate acyltransferase n=1 Tax=Paraburkholderia terricola TaxID=169427 RepID=A0A1M6JM83_9BURK|nr:MULTISPECIES: lysophospholipid acyltransferase family protein [Paraburkholderia]ORC48840.1 1-acyl-sn-glycerol-3-phosphate acyltransferase [Burkholderia sp. A27]MDR6409762.1 1-acyl-sn-glycerol-3-phosphate acyltransferase [Paraburkholderia terricola]MDR6446034.1 1-acyl-sn-glycerol-3-phosphate acyltransferase [Paraburkholderia terricola]MDR6480630.1 1-acyl-sn-glycerol-3-phosphate acyltransferase [Paraburkholderia terricola]MDR6492085.1 1-acyl-sn-glycerol-3-phosphate acyltransferase [Paraburkho
MIARLDYIWRFCATGMAFVVFGVCGLLFSVLVFPFAWLWPHRASRQFAVTTVIHWFFRALVAVLQRIGVMELEVSGARMLRAGGPAIVVANHPTYLDVMVLLSLTPHACCVVKNAHWGNPCFWGIVRSAEYVSNADPTDLVEAGARQLAAGYTMIIFPEGTRSPAPNRLHAFSRGFAHMALKAGAPIVPVLMDCDPPAFTKQMRWYDVPARAFRIRVNVLEPLGVEQFADDDTTPALAARSVTSAVEAHITRHLFDYGFFKTGN